jgi:hypothetical protein
VRLEGLGQLKKSTSSGLDPATLRLVAQRLIQLRYRVPPRKIKRKKKRPLLFLGSKVALSTPKPCSINIYFCKAINLSAIRILIEMYFCLCAYLKEKQNFNIKTQESTLMIPS